MGKPRRAKQKYIPTGSILCYNQCQIKDCWEDILDGTGRCSPLQEHAGERIVMIVLEKV